MTNLVVSCSDSKSGNVKESFEISNLSSTERERMIEIIEAARILEKEEQELHKRQEEEREGVVDVMKAKDEKDEENQGNMFFLELIIYSSAKKVISVAQNIKPFSLLPEADKMTLLKGSIAEILFLRSARVFNKTDECWILPRFQVSFRGIICSIYFNEISL